MKKIALLWAVFLMLAVIPVGCSTSAPAPEPPEVTEPPEVAEPPEETTEAPQIGLSVGNIAPNFQLEDLDGNLVSLWDLRGEVVFLNFWASWCGPCRSEMPSMEKIYQDYKDKGLEILAVNVQEDRDSVKSFVKSEGLSFLVLLDSGGTVIWIYQVVALPTTYLIDSQGVIQSIVIGSADWTDFAHRQMIEELLPTETENGSES